MYSAASAPSGNITDFSSTLVFQPITKSATTVAKTNGIGNALEPDNTENYICNDLPNPSNYFKF
jgi:hypothetical protein